MGSTKLSLQICITVGIFIVLQNSLCADFSIVCMVSCDSTAWDVHSVQKIKTLDFHFDQSQQPLLEIQNQFFFEFSELYNNTLASF